MGRAREADHSSPRPAIGARKTIAQGKGPEENRTSRFQAYFSSMRCCHYSSLNIAELCFILLYCHTKLQLKKKTEQSRSEDRTSACEEIRGEGPRFCGDTIQEDQNPTENVQCPCASTSKPRAWKTRPDCSEVSR